MSRTFGTLLRIMHAKQRGTAHIMSKKSPQHTSILNSGGPLTLCKEVATTHNHAKQQGALTPCQEVCHAEGVHIGTLQCKTTIPASNLNSGGPLTHVSTQQTRKENAFNVFNQDLWAACAN